MQTRYEYTQSNEWTWCWVVKIVGDAPFNQAFRIMDDFGNLTGFSFLALGFSLSGGYEE